MSAIIDDFVSDFSDDDDEEFLALTLKPQKHDDSTQTNDEIIRARGEIAVLRAKIQAIENKKHEEYETIVKENDKLSKEKSRRIEQLEEVVKRLESEKKFLAVEVRNLGHKKRKRPQSDVFSHNDGATLEPATSMTTETTAAPPSVSTSATITKAKVENVKLNTLLKDDNSLLIDAIINYTIPSTTKTTMTMLSKISLSDNFQFDGFTIRKHEPLSTYILQFLVSQRPVHRIDKFVTRFTHFLSSLCSHLFTGKKYQKFPIPYLLSLIHASVIFKPSAVTKSATKQLMIFFAHIISRLEICIKPNEINSEQYARRKRLGVSGIQFEMLDHLIMVFACDITESLLIIGAEDHGFIRDLVNTVDLLSFVKHAMNSSSNANVMLSVANWIICIMESFEESPLSDTDVKLISQLIETGVDMKQGWLFHGLNRFLGNNIDNQHIESLVGDELKDTPSVIYAFNLKDYRSQLKSKHESHELQLQLILVDILTKLVITIPSSIYQFNNRPDIFKSLVFAIGISQEMIHIGPRTPTTHIRSSFISSLIRFIHLIWEVSTMEGGASPAITKDSSHELMIVLARVAFSNSGAIREAAEFLLSVREQDTRTPVFNRWAERRALDLSHIDIAREDKSDDKDKIMQIVHAQMGFSNGLEFAYDDDVVECARDVLEKCTTMEEADALYMAMNTVDQSSNDQEMTGV
jgi:DNA damage checkpoint protein LCD1